MICRLFGTKPVSKPMRSYRRYHGKIRGTPDSLQIGNRSHYSSVTLKHVDRELINSSLYPRSTEGGKGVYWIHPDVCPSVRPSVRPSVGKVSATFRENYWLNSFHPWDLYLWGKSLDPYRFSCSCPHFWPSGGQKLTENRGFRNFSRKLSARFISSQGFILMG